MPIYEREAAFRRDLLQLTPAMRLAFRRAVAALVEDLRKRGPVRSALRMNPVQGHEGVFELTFAPDGRATFHFGAALIAGDRHVVWRRTGTQDIFRNP